MTTAYRSDEPLDHARVWIEAGHAVAVATVIRTWGSAPRPVGSHLVIRDDGHLEGSVSGGCVEGDVLVEAAMLIETGQGFQRLSYGVDDDTAWTVGLPCGGSIEVLVQRVAEDGYPPALIARVGDALARRETLVLATDLVTGRTVPADKAAEIGEPFLRVYGPPPRVMIIGAGHIAQALAPMANLAGFDVTVIDPRDRFATPERFPGITLDHGFPDEALAVIGIDSATAVVTLSHDTKIDDPALIAALRSPAFHIAALGSRRNQARRLERLAGAGFDEDALARLHGPAGLTIGALTPAEIAVSILAELVQAWRART